MTKDIDQNIDIVDSIGTIDLNDSFTTIDFSNFNSSVITSNNGTGNIGNYVLTNAPTSSGLFVSADAVIEGDLKVKGVSILEVLEKIQDRLSILVPDPAKLEQFEALKKAYDHYKLLESLCDPNFKKEE